MISENHLTRNEVLHEAEDGLVAHIATPRLIPQGKFFKEEKIHLF